MVARGEAAVLAAEALCEELDIGAHLFERSRIAKAIFIDGFMNDGSAFGLGQKDDEGLLPIGHEAGMDIRFDMDAASQFSFIEKFNAVVA